MGVPLHNRSVVVAVALLALSTLCVCCEKNAGQAKLRHVADIVVVQTDVGREYVLTTGPSARSDIVGAVYVRQPNRPQWTDAYLIVTLDGKTLSDEDELAVWVDRLREHAATLRTQGDSRAATKLEQYASLPLQPSE